MDIEMTFCRENSGGKRAWMFKVGSAFLLSLCVYFSPVFAGMRCVFFDSAAVNDTIIRLGDIAAVSGTTEGMPAESLARIPVGEAAPAGYSRFVAVDDVIRYRLHGRSEIFFDKKDRGKRLKVKTDFQEIGLSSYEPAVLDSLRSGIQWKAEDYQLKIINRNEKWKCLKRPFSITLEGLSSKYPKGNFKCRLIVHQGSKRIKVPIACYLSVRTPVLVSSVKIRRGTLLSSENCHIERMDITRFNYMPYIKLDDVEDRVISLSVNPGSIIHEKNTIPIPLIRRDEVVQLVVIKGNIRVCMSVRARESGLLGNDILVENETTHKILKAKIVKDGQVLLKNGDGAI
jgi:flagella basal body P-ring formation protein FlgA